MIDYEVQNIANSFRGNPQGLMQRYQQSQQLIDLLALQKIKKEKEEAARQLMLSQQNVPGTVLEQREKEVLDMTKQELQGQVGGTLNNMAQQQSSEGRQPNLYGGVASMAPTMGGFAEGGIVGFDKGGNVNGEDDLNWFERAVSGIGKFSRDNARAGEELRASELERGIANDLMYKQMFENLGRVYRGEPKLTEGEKAAMALRGPKKMTPNVKLDSLPEPRGIEALTTKPSEPQGGIAQLAQSEGSRLFDELAKESAERNRDPEAKRQAEQAAFKEMMSDPERETARKEAMDRRRAQREEMFDPETMRRDRLIAALLGAGGATSFGSAMKGAGLASQAARRQQQMAESEWRDADLNTEDALLKEIREINQGAYGAGVEAERTSEAAVQELMKSLNANEANAIQSQMERTHRSTLEFQKNMALLGANEAQIAELNQKIEEQVASAGGMQIDMEIVEASKKGDIEKVKKLMERKAVIRENVMQPYMQDLRSRIQMGNVTRGQLGMPERQLEDDWGVMGTPRQLSN